jgi:hypothetical protein
MFHTCHLPWYSIQKQPQCATGSGPYLFIKILGLHSLLSSLDLHKPHGTCNWACCSFKFSPCKLIQIKEVYVSILSLVLNFISFIKIIKALPSGSGALTINDMLG